MSIGEWVGAVARFTDHKRYRMEKSNMRKKIAAMALAVSMCAAFTSQNVSAASCPPHEHIRNFAGPVSSWTTTHKVYRNEYVGKDQVYSICTVTHTIVRYSMYCADCGKRLNEEDVEEVSHSLAGDPDHK